MRIEGEYQRLAPLVAKLRKDLRGFETAGDNLFYAHDNHLPDKQICEEMQARLESESYRVVSSARRLVKRYR